MQKKPETALKERSTSSFRYAIGMFGTSIPINMFKTFAAIFYVDMLGLEMQQFSVVLFVYTIVDAIDNPVYGFLSDNTRSKWGRRRPWLVIGTPILILSFIMFYNVPGFIAQDKKILFIYLLLMYIMTGTIDSLINANYGALFPELFSKDNVRAKTNSMRQAFQLVAMAISIALTPIITEKIGYSLTSIIYGIVAGAVILYCTFGCHENPKYQLTEKPKLLSSIKSLIVNPKFWIFGLANAFFSAAMALVMSALPFFVKYSLKLEGGSTTVLLGTVLGVALIGVGLWTQIVKKLKLLPSWRTSLLIMCLGFIPMYFMNTLIGSMAIACIVGFGASGILVTMDVIAAKIMDEDYKKYGVKREGIYASAIGVMNRLNGLFTSLAFFLAQNTFGFVSGENPGPNPELASKFLFIIFPFASLAISCAFSLFMNFKEETSISKDKKPTPNYNNLNDDLNKAE